MAATTKNSLEGNSVHDRNQRCHHIEEDEGAVAYRNGPEISGEQRSKKH